MGSFLRRKNKSVEYDLMGRSLSKQISDAENRNAEVIIIFNLNEMKINGNVILRTKGEKTDKKLKVDENFEEINNILLKR